MSWAVKLVDQICKVFSTDTEKSSFIQQLESTFSQVTREVFEHSAAGGGAFCGVTFSSSVDPRSHGCVCMALA